MGCRATNRPFEGRLLKRLAGSRSEPQPPGARMAVRKRKITRGKGTVKSYARCCSSNDRASRLWLMAGNCSFHLSRLLQEKEGGFRFPPFYKLRHEWTVFQRRDVHRLAGNERNATARQHT